MKNFIKHWLGIDEIEEVLKAPEKNYIGGEIDLVAENLENLKELIGTETIDINNFYYTLPSFFTNHKIQGSATLWEKHQKLVKRFERLENYLNISWEKSEKEGYVKNKK
jgi:lipoate-protein ligase A